MAVEGGILWQQLFWPAQVVKSKSDLADLLLVYVSRKCRIIPASVRGKEELQWGEYF